jgi:ABC-type Mn2+/Zn2+ transport system ATPase subunit
MNRISVLINEVQHISRLVFSVDLEVHGLHCIVGRNGAGKTTLVRALRNLSNADTFIKTASPRIFRAQSQITYNVDGRDYVFSYDAKLKSLNCRDSIPEAVRTAVSAELPMPYGARFNFAKSASEADSKIRASIALQDYQRPAELIHFLESVYDSEKYENLIGVSVKNKTYYAIENADGTYIREDNLSSGEFFLINLYRTIKSKARLIVIDEIDLSLDAAAQAKLSEWLRGFCQNYGCSILFTTHSLAVMRTLKDSELTYIGLESGVVSVFPASYSYAKARLFGFSGWDRYILTEDKMLVGLIEFLIANHCERPFFDCKTIYIGGGFQVADLLRRNQVDGFLSRPENVIAILDGDQRNEPHATEASVHLIPIESVEKELYARAQDPQNFSFRLPHSNFRNGKEIRQHLRNAQVATDSELYTYIVQENLAAFQPIIELLKRFLNPRD